MTEFGPEHSGTATAPGSTTAQVHGVTDEMKGAARDVAEEARAAGSSLRDQAAGLGHTLKQGLTHQVERQKNGIADRLSAVAKRTQETAADLRENEAWLGALLGRGADELESVAEEIRRNDVPGILGSVEVFARRQPALFMGASVALGFAMTRFVSAGPVSRDRFGHDGERWDAERWDTQGSYATGDVGTHARPPHPGPAPDLRPDPTVAGSNI